MLERAGETPRPDKAGGGALSPRTFLRAAVHERLRPQDIGVGLVSAAAIASVSVLTYAVALVAAGRLVSVATWATALRAAATVAVPMVVVFTLAEWSGRVVRRARRG